MDLGCSHAHAGPLSSYCIIYTTSSQLMRRKQRFFFLCCCLLSWFPRWLIHMVKRLPTPLRSGSCAGLDRLEKINGTVAYAAQRAWIQNATLRDNVLFGCPFDPERYARVLAACALTSDLDLLEAGDQTEIGEKG